MADVPFAFIRDMMAAALGVEAHLLRPPYKDAQEFDYRLSRILRADFDYKDIFSASAMHGLEEGTVYYVHNTLELNYVFMPVPGPKPRSVLLFGPFLYEAASGPFFERVLAQNRIGKGDAAALRTFLRHRTRGGRAHDGCGGTRRGMPACTARTTPPAWCTARWLPP